MAIQDRDREEWAMHPVTQELLADLRETKQETMEAWARELFVGETAHSTMQANAKALGGLHVVNQIIEVIESNIGKQPEVLQ